MYDDYSKVLNSIYSSNTVEQLLSCETLCKLFEIKWSHDTSSIVYLERLKLRLKHKKDIYGEY